MTTTTRTEPLGPDHIGNRPRPRERAVPAPIPMGRLLAVELRKMFDTRSGFWLMASIVIFSVIATGVTIVFAPEVGLSHEDFAAAIGFPMSIILPMVALLSVTSEWSQRSALTTFTLVPSRSRVIAAKLVCTVAIGLVSMLVAGVVGALGNVVGTAILGVDRTWDVGVLDFTQIILGNEVGMLMGFMLGVVLRSSAGAIVAYFVYSLMLPVASGALMATNEWWAEHGGWLDFKRASVRLFEDEMTRESWAQLGVTGLFWLVIPLAVGLRVLMRAEVK